ncbi:MAG: flagellar basal body rod C-terminal domain-containing protein [Acetobacteraceae bacterium]|nr:flagellar basal body rod C-terminal domain-containing protein [Acetobacteraceae bacterium]
MRRWIPGRLRLRTTRFFAPTGSARRRIRSNSSTSPLSVTAGTTLLDYAGLVVARHALVHDSAARAEEQARVSRDVARDRLADAVGISVDREMALLVELQNAYLANARVLSTVQAMWDALLASVR